MQISSFSALSGPSALFGANGSLQQRPRDAGQFLPNQASLSRSSALSRPDNAVFSLPRHSLTAAAASQSSAVQTQLTASQAVAAYQSAMNAQGVYGYQAMLGMKSVMA